MNNKGQFFSPDLLIAISIFLVILGFFFYSSNSVFSQIDFFEIKKDADEVSHSTMNILVYSPGVPFNWEEKSLADTNLFGLALNRNVISQEKLVALITDLNNSYSQTKSKLGFGRYDFKLQLLDLNGSVLYTSYLDSNNTKLEIIYERTVLFNEQIAVLRGVVGLEK